MKFTIAQDVLKTELAYVQSVVERRNMIPVLANVLIESISEDAIRISGTDLDVTIRVDAVVEGMPTQGAMCVQARKLFDIARLLPSGPVTFIKADNDWVTVEAGKSTFKLPGISKETFPELSSFKATPLAINAALLTSLIQQTIFATTQEEGRYTLSGAKFEISKSRTRVITTDGHRLALVETNGAVRIEQDGPLEVLLPRKTLAELMKISAGFDGEVNFGVDENHVYFQIGARAVISRLLSGQFPNYEMVLPKNNDNVVTFDRAELNKALKRIALMADDRSHAISLAITKDQTTISAETQTEGEGQEVIASELAGDEVTVGFNAQYIQDVLNVTTTQQVSFHFKDNNSQGEFRPVSDDSTHTFKCVVMPMRL